MSRNTAERLPAPQPLDQGAERAKLLTWLESYEPRTELGRKLRLRRIAAVKAGQVLLDYEGLMREARERRGEPAYDDE